MGLGTCWHGKFTVYLLIYVYILVGGFNPSEKY